MNANGERGRADREADRDEPRDRKPAPRERAKRLVKPPVAAPDEMVDLYQGEMALSW